MRHDDVDTEVNRVSGDGVDAALLVHRCLGPGLLERVYARCLARELERRGHEVARELSMPVTWEGESIAPAYRIDLLVDGVVLVEIKHVESILPVHVAQVRTYLMLAGAPVGLLLNFNVVRLPLGLRRISP